MSTRTALLEQVARAVPQAGTGWVRVAVDGVDGAGKTLFADELAQVLRTAGRPVVRASVDGFHFPRAHRYRRGRDSWEGYWRDAFDLERLRTDLLDPLAPDGSGRHRPAVHDVASDRQLDLPYEVAPAGAVLLLDGVFLHRDELRNCWDASISLDVPFEVSVPRVAARDGTDPDPESPRVRRYVKAQRHYLRVADPRSRATLVVDNSDLAHPRIVLGA